MERKIGKQGSDVPGNDRVDFYVMLMSQYAVAEDEVWLIFRGVPNSTSCVGVRADCIDAVNSAIRMAEYRVLSGHPSQVHVRERDAEAWSTVWKPEQENALYPQCVAGDAEPSPPR